MSTKPLLVTMGDPSGIGPEIIAKAAVAGHADGCVVLGSERVMHKALVEVGHPKLQVNTITSLADARNVSSTVNVFPTPHSDGMFPKGRVSSASGRAAYEAIAAAISFCNEGQASGIVTAPIHKEALSAAGVKDPGHTEILARLSGTDKVAMMLVNDEIRTVLVTIHVSLRNAIEQADFNAQISAIRLAHNACRDLGIAKPRVAVAGLNPHAGEGGLFGREEIDIIAPAIEAARSDGIDASGPWPGDTVFMAARRGKFDIVVAQYHDQGLIPVKYMGIETGVNVTLGLPFVRTSPDHGTAFDIAGQGVAAPDSLITAITTAHRMVAARAAPRLEETA